MDEERIKTAEAELSEAAGAEIEAAAAVEAAEVVDAGNAAAAELEAAADAELEAALTETAQTSETETLTETAQMPETDAAPANGTDAPARKSGQVRSGSVFRNMGKKLSEGTFRTLFGFIVLVLLSAKIIFDFDGFRGFLGKAGRMLLSLLGYLLIGFIIAYVLNAFIMWLKAHPLKKIKSDKARNIVGIIIAYIVLSAVLTFLIGSIVPKVIDSVSSLAKLVPSMADRVYNDYLDIVEGGKFDLPDFVTEGIKNGIDGMKNWLMGLLSSDLITGYVPKILTATGSGIFKIIMGLLVSVYMLLEKDRALAAAKRINNGLFRSERAEQVADGGRKINAIFNRYFAGKLLQATVVLLLAYVILLIGGVNYAILFATVIAITNMIPYIGPWIGGVPTIIISFVQDPWMGTRALICVLIIQAIDNWLLTPRIIGNKMGISPLLVLIGLGIGGNLFGFVGVLIGDVMAAIVKVFFYDTFIEHRIQKKIERGELPPDYKRKPDVEDEERKPTVIERLFAKIGEFFKFLGRKIAGLFKKLKERRAERRK